MNTNNKSIEKIMANQLEYFYSGGTRDLSFRIKQLQNLKKKIRSFESEIEVALKADLGKSPFEAYTSEIGFIYEEINHTLNNLPTWVESIPVSTPLVHFPSSSQIIPSPKGLVLVVAPWNYPFQLAIAPIIAAVSAGNCVILKPSEIAGQTETILLKLIKETFEERLVSVVSGGVDVTTTLLAERFDHIFFTGSIPVGKIVMNAASKTLSPVTLELGGKSPCFVDEKVNIKVAARRIIWGKFYNAGQTCVAPDYLLVHKSIKDKLLVEMKAALIEFYGTNPEKSEDYGRIINAQHFDRLRSLLDGLNPLVGGKHNKESGYIEPTLIDNVPIDSKIMEDEIFGPLLPILTVNSMTEALEQSRQRPNPLACYIFTSSKKIEQMILDGLSFGGGCVNNTLVHLSNPELPFGGVGQSGIGAYHAKDGFDVFSHKKSIMKTGTWFDSPLKYPPYTSIKSWLARFVMR